MDYQCKRFELEISEIIWFQFVFKKYLSRKQWLSLLILTVGCVIQKMDIPSFRSQSEIANPKARIEDITKDNTNILPQSKTLDSTYISMSAGLFFIFVQVRFSVYNTPNLIQNYLVLKELQSTCNFYHFTFRFVVRYSLAFTTNTLSNILRAIR